MSDPKFTINVHMTDDVKITANKVTDFVSVGLGWQTSIFLFSSEQAKALANAATEAFLTLKGMEAEVEANSIRNRMVTPRNVPDTVDWSYGNPQQETDWDESVVDWDEECSDLNPCPSCRNSYIPDYAYDDEPDWDDRF